MDTTIGIYYLLLLLTVVLARQ